MMMMMMMRESLYSSAFLVVKITHLIFSKNWMRTSSLLHLTPLAGEFKLVFARGGNVVALVRLILQLPGIV